MQDIGTGIGTVLAQVVAEELGLRPEDITVVSATPSFPPGRPRYGSRTTASITPPARNAAFGALQSCSAQLAPRWARRRGAWSRATDASLRPTTPAA